MGSSRTTRLRGPLLVACVAAAAAAACDLGLSPFEPDAGPEPMPTSTFDTGAPDTSPPIGKDTGADTAMPDAVVDAPMDGDGASTVKRVFVTSTMVPGSFGGVAQADAICASAATGEKLGGTWRAWLSISGSPAIARLTDVGGWYLLDRKTLVFPNLAAIASGQGPMAAIDRDEKNAAVPPQQTVWTATTKNGQAAAQSCQNFTAQAPFGGITGRPVANANWTEADNTPCQAQARIYCFEQ